MKRDELIALMARATWCEHQEDTLSDVMRHCEVILEAIEAAGMRVVPVEPTKAMIEAARGCRNSIMHDHNTKATWTAMLHAVYGDAFRRLAAMEKPGG